MSVSATWKDLHDFIDSKTWSTVNIKHRIWGDTYWTIKGFLSKINAFVSIADIAWCFAADFNTNPLSPGTVFSFSSSTSHLPKRKKQTPTMQSLGKQKKYADKRHYSLVAKRSKEFTAYKTNCQSREEALTLHVKVRSLITIIQQSTDHSPSDTSDYTGPPYTSPSFNALQLYNTERIFVAHKFDAHILLSNHQHSISTSTSQQLETTTILIHSKDDKITKPPGQKI